VISEEKIKKCEADYIEFRSIVEEYISKKPPEPSSILRVCCEVIAMLINKSNDKESLTKDIFTFITQEAKSFETCMKGKNNDKQS
jgi:hypothetical protein